MSARTLQRRAMREAALQEAAVVRFEAELHRVYRRLTVLLRQSLETWGTDETGRMERSTGNLLRVFTLRRQARQLIREAGYDQLALFAVGDPLDELAASILTGARSLGPNLADALTAWKELRLADLLDLADDAARTIQRVALDGTLGLRPVDRLVLDVSRALDLSQRQARTIYDTAVSVFARQVEQVASTGEPDELFLYVGPVDEVVRPFCRTWIGKVRTRAAVDALDNGQLPDVFVTGGGYNCRHKWARVSELDDELRAIAGTDQRAPGIDWMLAGVA
jgi:histone H3/H4